MFDSLLLDREAVLGEIERRIAEAQGIVNAQQAEIVRLTKLADDVGAWQESGVRSLSQWIAWQTGSTSATARKIAGVVERAAELPATVAAFSNGELSLDQVATVAAYTPAWADQEACDMAHAMTPAQLHRVLGKYDFGQNKPKPEKRYGIDSGFDDDGDFWIRGRVKGEEGARLHAAMTAAKDTVTQEWKDERSGTGLPEDSEPPTWLDAVLRMADRSLATELAERPHHPRAAVVIHLDLDKGVARVHMGPALSKAERRLVTCDATFRKLYEERGRPIGIDRTSQQPPRWLRRAVEHRDKGCRVPGCRARYVQLHHVWHWEDGGPTETWNLMCLCPVHHRMHHRGLLGIHGSNADDPTGITFTDRYDRQLPGVAPPTPPSGPPPTPRQRYEHPTGERLPNLDWISFNQRTAA